ncbi:hypothetical protein T439DRAFT_336349 [Meredithblackwellia eburnea MCA 4105]
MTSHQQGGGGSRDPETPSETISPFTPVARPPWYGSISSVGELVCEWIARVSPNLAFEVRQWQVERSATDHHSDNLHFKPSGFSKTPSPTLDWTPKFVSCLALKYTRSTGYHSTK